MVRSHRLRIGSSTAPPRSRCHAALNGSALLLHGPTLPAPHHCVSTRPTVRTPSASSLPPLPPERRPPAARPPALPHFGFRPRHLARLSRSTAPGPFSLRFLVPQPEVTVYVSVPARSQRHVAPLHTARHGHGPIAGLALVTREQWLGPGAPGQRGAPRHEA